MLTKRDATALAKQFRLGNRFRKKSLIKKYNLVPATSKNTGRVKMGIRMDVENRPRDYYPALDDDGSLIFFSGNPIKRLPLSTLFTPPKARKETTEENAMINYKLEMLKKAFPNEDTSLLETYLSKHDFDINKYSILEIKKLFKSFKNDIQERTEYQLVAQKKDGTELKSAFYKNENDLADMQQKCEDSDEYESHCVMKRIVDTDEEEEDTIDYTDGEQIEGAPEEVEENKAKAYEELRTLYNLTNLALRQIPGSPKQRATIKKLNDVRKKLGMKPLKEMEIDINDEINESFYKVDIPGLPTTFVEADSVTEVRTAMRDKLKPDVFGKIDIKKVSKAEITKKFRELAKDVGKPGGDSVKDIEENVEEQKMTLDTIGKKFKGSDKKLGGGVIDMIKSKSKPKEIAKAFKKLKTPTQELIMTALGDKSAQQLLQKGQLLNQLVGIFDDVEEKGLDARSKSFREKIRKLEYNKKKPLPYEMFENSAAADQAKRLNLTHLGNGVYGRKPGDPSHKTVDGKLTKMTPDEIKQHQDGDRDLDGKPGVKEPDAPKDTGGDTEKKPETPEPDSFDQINIDSRDAMRLGNYWKNVKPQKITVYADDEDEFIEADMEPDSPVERYYQHYLDALGIDHEEGDIERTDKNMAIFNKIGATDNAKIGELLSKITIDQGVAKKVLAKAKGVSASEPKEPEGEEKPKSKSQELIGKIDDKSMSTGDARKAIYKAFGNDTYGPYGTFAGGVLDPSDNTSTFVDNDIGTPTFGKDVEIKMKNRARQSTVIKMLKTLGFDEYRDINRKKDRLEIDYDSKTFEKLGIAGRDNDKKRTEVMRALLNGDKKYYYKMLVRLAEIEGKFGLGKAKQESKKEVAKRVIEYRRKTK
jgi:hypothetical protein